MNVLTSPPNRVGYASFPDGVSRLIDEGSAKFGDIDILVNNAGITSNIPFLDVIPTFYDHLMSVNVRAMYFLTQAFARNMRDRGSGIIVNLCSLHASFAMNEHSV